MQGLSAGRVQSVAVRLVVERERERRAFVSAGYWDISGIVRSRLVRGPPRSSRRQARRAGPRLHPAGRAQVGRPGPARRGAGARARGRARGPHLRRPLRRREAVHAPPGRAVHDLDPAAGGEPQAPLHLADDDARRPAAVRERLHHLHAHRLDDAVGVGADRGARARPSSSTAPTRSPSSRAGTARKVKNAQEAHEAIRPAGDSFRTPKELERELNRDELALYDLIWKRTLASQMADARGLTVSLRLGTTTPTGRDAEFSASGTVITFRGFLAAYEESRDDDDGEGGGAPAPAPEAGRRAEGAPARARGPRDHAALALHRGEPRPGARGARDRPAVHVRLDHRHDPRPRLRLQARHRARAVLPRLRGHRPARAALRPARRLLLHRPDGGRPRPDRRRRAGAGRLAAPLLLRRRRRRRGPARARLRPLRDRRARRQLAAARRSGIVLRVGRYGPVRRARRGARERPGGHGAGRADGREGGGAARRRRPATARSARTRSGAPRSRPRPAATART